MIDTIFLALIIISVVGSVAKVSASIGVAILESQPPTAKDLALQAHQEKAAAERAAYQERWNKSPFLNAYK